jgi:hypothetical protein
MRFRSLVIVPVVLSAALLTGCTGQNAQPQGGQTPEAVDDGAVLVALEAIDPGLNTQDSITDAQAVCKDFDDKVDSETIDEHARELFSDQAETQLTIEQAQEIVRTLATNYCV